MKGSRGAPPFTLRRTRARRRAGERVVTGDPVFKALGKEIKIVWLK